MCVFSLFLASALNRRKQRKRKEKEKKKKDKTPHMHTHFMKITHEYTVRQKNILASSTQKRFYIS